MITATQKLLELVRARLSGCSYYSIAKSLGVTETTVSDWRHGKHQMSTANVIAICDLAGLTPQVFEWVTRVTAEREKGPERDLAVRLLEDLQRLREGRELPEDSLLGALCRVPTGDVPRKIASAVLVPVMLALGAMSVPPQAEAAAGGVRLTQPVIHYAKSRRGERRRWFRALRRFFGTVFPAPAAPTFA